MFFTIYETINCVNGKKYIGKHATLNVEDDYLGSGILLTKAIKKYGRDNFSKNTLFVFDSEEEMNAKERELIDQSIVESEEYYNVSYGGEGGTTVLRAGHPLYEDTKRKISLSQQERREEMSSITKENHRLKRVGMYGKKQSNKQKQAVSAAQKGRKRTTEELEKQKNSLLKTIRAPDYKHPNNGKKRTSEMVENMRKRTLSRPQKRCAYCDTLIDERNYARYHGEKCKKKS